MITFRAALSAMLGLMLSAQPVIGAPPASRHHGQAPAPVPAEPAPAAPPETAAEWPLCKPSHVRGHGNMAPALIRQDYEPRPAMWRLADDDTTITIFGTYHVLPQGLRWRTPLFDQVMAEAEEVVFESRDDAEDADAPLTIEGLRFMTLMLKYRPKEPLSQRIAERNRPKLARTLQLAGITPDKVEWTPPLITMFAIAAATSEAEGSQRDLGVESVIEAEFKASGRPISAIEDPVEVLGKLLEIDEAKMIAMLDEGFDEWDGCQLTDPEGADWSSEHDWAQGKLGDESIKEMMDDPFGKAFYDVLLVQRNRAWTQWLADRMARPGKLLLAVGAGHMEGPDSVILMLEAQGLKVERIQ